MCFSILFWRAEQQQGPSSSFNKPANNHKLNIPVRDMHTQIKLKSFSLQSFLLLHHPLQSP